MIALTQEQREELAKFAKATLNSLNGIEPEDPNQYDDCLSEYTQKCMKIALASQTAAPSGYRWFHEGSPETRGWYASCYPLDSDYLERCLVDKSIHSHEPLYTAPPVPEINKDDYIGLQVSVDVSTCDDDAGHRYFGKVSALSESNGEVVLVIEESERNFTAPPVPEINTSSELTALLNAVESFKVVKASDKWNESGKWDNAYDKLSEAAIKAAPLIKRLNGSGE
ncbi:hypothetical protein [Rosenbergiella nectarea]|uniref:hypothetical protein n=1 Tax=Rosenbergiella nectarea TaxID=988801 RepID=UPI001F4EF318|nr:hypothetical protein [Rosenbergiella nectarea]